MQPLTPENIKFFLIVFLPGIVCVKVHDLFHPSDRKSLSEASIEAAVCGLLNLGFWFWSLKVVLSEGFHTNHPGLAVLFGIGAGIITPAALAVLWHKTRTSIWVARQLKRIGLALDYPTKNGWDRYFSRGEFCFVRCHLKDGSRVGGYYGDKSYAATFPQPADVYIEKTWLLDDSGEFVREMEGTAGMVVRAADCHFIEFLAPTTPGGSP